MHNRYIQSLGKCQNKEYIFTRVNNPTFNKNIGQNNLPHIWAGVLNNIPELQVKNQ